MRNTLIAIAVGASLLFAVMAFAQGGMGWGGWGGPGMRGPGYHMYGGGGYGYGCGYGPGPGYSADNPGNYPYPGYYCWAPEQSLPSPETAPQAPAPQTTPAPKQ